MDKELSDLFLERKECPKCGAVWMNGQHYWTGTGRVGDEQDLSNLVCRIADHPTCINPSYTKGLVYSEKDTWEKRRTLIDKLTDEIQ
jgi:hypothetical protein